MGTPIYVPVLKGKEGEFAALEALAADVRAEIMPLIEVPSVPYDYANDRPSKTLADHIAAVADRIGRCWTESIYIDLPWIETDERLTDGREPIAAMLENCGRLDVSAVPVLSRETSALGLASAGRYAETSRLGCCLRLLIGDFEEDTDLEQDINRIFDAIGRVEIESTDLVIDLEDLGNDGGRAVLLVRSIFSMIPYKDRWRRLIISAASFPEDLSDVDASTISLLPRREWQLWKTLQKRPAILPRREIIYSDYGIAHPIPRELDPRTMRMSANIRYTAQEDWLIVKGRNVRQYGFEQYFELCRTLVRRQEYSGRDFSWGDNYIAECAAGNLGPGNATTWRKVGTNHHITIAVRSLAEL
jgi:Beta protein